MPATATAQVLEKSLERANKELRSVGSKLLDVTPPEKHENVRREYDELAGQVKKRKEFLTKDSALSLTQDDLSAEVGKIELAFSSGAVPAKDGVPDELKKPIRDIRTDLELNDRLFSLSRNAPKDKQKAEAALRWFSQKKDGFILDYLFEVTDHLIKLYDEETITIELLKIAKEGIIGRGYGELLKFYSCSESEMLQILENTIEHYADIQPVTLKDYFKAECPTQVLEHLQEMQGILEEYVEQAEIRRWLGAPNKLFAGQSPRMALLTGNTFKVYQFLIGLAHGVHI